MSTIGLTLWIVAGCCAAYGFTRKELDETKPHQNMRYAFLISSVLQFTLGLGFYAGGSLPDIIPPSPPAPPDPEPPAPDPPAPQPVSKFEKQLQAAFKADGGSRQQALILGGLADAFGDLIPLHPQLFDEHQDIGPQWEKVRGDWLPEVKLWAPKTSAVISAEAGTRGFKVHGPLNNEGRAAYSQFYEEMGDALLSYE